MWGTQGVALMRAGVCRGEFTLFLIVVTITLVWPLFVTWFKENVETLRFHSWLCAQKLFPRCSVGCIGCKRLVRISKVSILPAYLFYPNIDFFFRSRISTPTRQEAKYHSLHLFLTRGPPETGNWVSTVGSFGFLGCVFEER